MNAPHGGDDIVTHGRSPLFLLLMPLLLAAPAAAQSAAVCDDLRSQLAGAPQIIGNTSEARRYANAMTSQTMQIRKLRNDMRRMGCTSGSIIVYGGANQTMCAELQDTMAAMEENRQALVERRNDAMQQSRSAQGERQRILAALETNGCMGGPAEAPIPVAVSPDQRRDTVPDFLSPDEAGEQARLPSHYDSRPQSGLRTLCVRTCDGAFFPISSNASPLDFRRHAEVCARMCPGTETELYYHSLTGQESADMVSATTGTPYLSLPTAFAYRNLPVGEKSECGCDLTSYHREMQRSDDMHKPKQPVPYSAITTIGPPAKKAEEDNRAEAPMPERPYNPADSNVRVVGPQFLPAETSRIDLANPATSGPQPLQ